MQADIDTYMDLIKNKYQTALNGVLTWGPEIPVHILQDPYITTSKHIPTKV